MSDERAADTERRIRAIVTAIIGDDEDLTVQLLSEDPHPDELALGMAQMVAFMVMQLAIRYGQAPVEAWRRVCMRLTEDEGR